MLADRYCVYKETTHMSFFAFIIKVGEGATPQFTAITQYTQPSQLHMYIHVDVYRSGVPNGNHSSKCLLLLQNG